MKGATHFRKEEKGKKMRKKRKEMRERKEMGELRVQSGKDERVKRESNRMAGHNVGGEREGRKGEGGERGVT